MQLPVDARLPDIVETIRRHRAAIVVAAPGAGKTTRIPPALTEFGKVGVLQPRRVAARSLARRVAEERGWTLGREVGWHVRNDRKFARDTRLVFMTEGILAARLQSDPLAGDFSVVVLDEFHERTIHADLALAMSREAWRARSDLALVVMSATLDAARVSAFLDGAPVIEIEGRMHPLSVSYEPGGDAAAVAAREIANGARAVLCFLPGAREIRAVVDGLAPASRTQGFDVLPLHGGLAPDEQDRAITPGARPRVIVATNIAETSLTVPDVTAVIDRGLQRVARYDSARGIDVLSTERITQDAADQRAGRAGRVTAGRAIRLWDERDRLRPHREPEIERVDLAPAALTILAWGGNPRTVGWLDAPAPGSLDAAFALLRRLGAVDDAERITPLGRRMQSLPMHPRLARILIDAGGAFEAAAACAILSEPQLPALRRGSAIATSCDVLPLIDAWNEMPGSIRRSADEFLKAISLARERSGAFGAVRSTEPSGVQGSPPRRFDETALRHALFTGFSDRAARRREPRGRSLLLASGAGARQADTSGVIDDEFLVCLDVGGASAEPLVRLASAVDRSWLSPTRHEVVHAIGEDGVVRAVRTAFFGALPIASGPVSIDPLIAREMLADAWMARLDRDDQARQLLNRLACAGIAIDIKELARAAASRATRLEDLDVERALPHADRVALEKRAPSTLSLPSGRQVALEYRPDGSILAAAKLQELFGLLETPRVMSTPVTFELLSPAGRPVQVTQDLASFWRRGYPEVRKELRARYPRHPWPEDPLTATPTARPKPRR